MAKTTNKRRPRPAVVKKTRPTKRPRKLLDAKKYAGAIPGMSEWALDEVRRMRDEW
ncbi:MAG: hypothetical protein RBT71_00490 [Flavobacteriales bacterium]|jgi:hypothetical protein|nr:hypothetical protein [Flavobacteriales bacterium]